MKTLYPWRFSGTKPGINTLGEKGGADASFETESRGTRFPYQQAGTGPEINTLGIPGENDIQAAEADDTYTPIPYKMCGEDEF